jgi:hypothetical protein
VDLLELRLDPFSVPIYVILLIKIHLDFQLLISLVLISSHQRFVAVKDMDKHTRLILSPNLAYSHSTSCSRDESCSFEALAVSSPVLRQP